jgi:DNA-binding NarL/FixJ family response regulator
VIRVLVADDHAPTRDEVADLLEQDGRFRVVASVGDASAAVSAAIAKRPDLCLLDISMPGGGILAVWEISARLPNARIVMLTVSARDSDLFGALRAGAHGYLLKDTEPARLPQSLHDVMHGEAALDGALLMRVVEQFRDTRPRYRSLAAPDEERPLTTREWQVLELMRQGLTVTQIARELVVSPITVRRHASTVFAKLCVRNRDELLRLFGARSES